MQILYIGIYEVSVQFYKLVYQDKLIQIDPRHVKTCDYGLCTVG